METPKGYDIYRLLDGTEVLRSPEDRVLFHRTSNVGMPLTVDADVIIDEVLDTLDETNRQIEVLSDSLNRIEELLTDDLSVNSQAINAIIGITKRDIKERRYGRNIV
jgi:predicted RNA methylase